MRTLGLGLVLAAGCTDAGAHLTFSAPTGPADVTSFEVVLASPDEVPSVAGQRTSPGRLETETVSYYLQRTIAGGTHGEITSVDGFAVRVEPDPALTETDFIPFVLMYQGDQIVGVATYRAADSAQPAPILVKRDEIDKYVLAVEPATQVTDMDAAAAGQVRVVTCARTDQTTFTSGLVWRPQGGGELRLLFPADGGLDATGRALDLDCDGKAVAPQTSGPDCDDTRDWFHAGAQETCDGFDTNCDGLQSLVVACPGTANVCADPTTGTGLALCDDRTGTLSACQSDPQCACAANPTACSRCILQAENGSTATMVEPCQPGLGYTTIEQCSDLERCPRVEVLQVSGGWKAEIAADLQAPVFGLVATNVGAKVLLRVKRPEGPGVEIPGTRGASTGDLVLGITSPDGSTHMRAIDLQLEGDLGTICQGSGPYQMVCYP